MCPQILSFNYDPNISEDICIFTPNNYLSWIYKLYFQEEHSKINASSSKVVESTYATGIFRRIRERKYKEKAMTIPAIKFWKRRLLSLPGTKVPLKAFVRSNIRYEIYKSKGNIQWLDIVHLVTVVISCLRSYLFDHVYLKISL